MVPNTWHRRDILRAGGVATVAGLAGCLGSDDSEDTEPVDPGPGDPGSDDSDPQPGGDHSPLETADVRPYTEYVAPDGAGDATAMYVDRVADASTGGWFESDFLDREDQLLTLPTQGYGAVSEASAVLTLAGLGTVLDSQGRFDSEVEASLVASGAFVAAGDIDPDEIDQELRAETEAPLGAFEQVETVGGYSLYQPTSGEQTTMAVSGADIVAGEQGAVDRVIEAAAGDRERAIAGLDAFGWVLDTVGDHQVALASNEGLAVTDSLAGAEAVAATHGFEAGVLRAELAAVFESESALDGVAGEIDDAFGVEATDRETAFEGDRVHVSGTYPG